MRHHRHHLRTPNKDHEQSNRKLKWSAEESRTPKKIVKKCLDTVFMPGSEDLSIESAKDSLELSSISEVLDENQLNESVENYVDSSSPAVSPSIASDTSDLSLLYSTVTSDASPISVDVSPCSLTSSSVKAQAKTDKVNHKNVDSSDIVKGDSSNAELFAKQLRQAESQGFKPNNMTLVSKNVLELLFKVAIEEIHNLPEKRDWFTNIVEKKVYNVLKKVFCVILTFMLLIMFVGIFVISSGDGASYNELVPT